MGRAEGGFQAGTLEVHWEGPTWLVNSTTRTLVSFLAHPHCFRTWEFHPFNLDRAKKECVFLIINLKTFFFLFLIIE